MSAPLSTAHTMPSATHVSSPEQGFTITTGSNFALPHRPAMPTPFPRVAAMIPATCVPWLHPSVATVVPAGMLMPGRMRPASSGCAEMPESITPMTMSGLPVAMSHASTARMSAPTTPPVWPVFRSAYCVVNEGSLGTSATPPMPSTPAISTPGHDARTMSAAASVFMPGSNSIRHQSRRPAAAAATGSATGFSGIGTAAFAPSA